MSLISPCTFKRIEHVASHQLWTQGYPVHIASWKPSVCLQILQTTNYITSCRIVVWGWVTWYECAPAVLWIKLWCISLYMSSTWPRPRGRSQMKREWILKRQRMKNGGNTKSLRTLTCWTSNLEIDFDYTCPTMVYRCLCPPLLTFQYWSWISPSLRLHSSHWNISHCDKMLCWLLCWNSSCCGDASVHIVTKHYAEVAEQHVISEVGGVSSPLGRPPRKREIVSCRACVRAEPMLGESNWVQVNPSEFKWVQVSPSESKWVQVNPSEPKCVQVRVQANPSIWISSLLYVIAWAL